MRKKILIAVASLLFFVQSKTIAQTGCGWKQGDMFTRTQTDWDVATNWYNGYDQAYSSTFGVIEVGIPGTSGYSLRFTDGDRVTNFFVQSGNPAALTGDLVNTTSSPSGGFGGEIVALRMNIDFSDFNIAPYTSAYKFGDLILYDLDNFPQLNAPELNGKSVREIMDVCNLWLGGGTSISNMITLSDLLGYLNGSFSGGNPSQFAQDHLKKGWQQGDMFTRYQIDWDANNSWFLDYNDVYSSSSGEVEIGLSGASGFSNRFTGPDRVSDYFVQIGSPNVLNADLIDPTNSNSHALGGEVLALRLNVDFSDANKLPVPTLYPFGDLILVNYSPLSQLNGKSVRKILSVADTILGAGSSVLVPTTAQSLIDINDLLVILNLSFRNGTPSQFAKDHLKKPWKQDDMFTRTQVDWFITHSWYSNYNDVYSSSSGEVEIGLSGASGFSHRFTGPGRVSDYFIRIGSPNVFNGDLVDGTSDVSGGFGGEVLALKLNVDFSDANQLPIATLYPFGDLILVNYPTLSQLNGKSVRKILSVADTILGAGSSVLVPTTAQSLIDIVDLVVILNLSFRNGTPNPNYKDYLISPCEFANMNHCPVATAANVTTKVGAAINIQLQATDADNNALTYNISQDASHGSVTTSASGAATYTPAACYYGADEFKFKANDGKCDGEATVTVTIVKCPAGKGNWVNNPGSWPSSAIPMLLGTLSYTQQQLITILKTPVGTGNKADASLILAHQLIPAKLNVADGAVTPAEVSDAIAAADALIGNNIIPMKIRPNTPLGQQMVTIAAILENYNKALLTPACQSTVPLITNKQQNPLQETTTLTAEALNAKLYPNPSTSYFNILITSNDEKEKIVVQVFDQYGRLVSVKNNISNGSTVRIGELYQPGVYYVRVLQGSQHKELKLVKL